MRVVGRCRRKGREEEKEEEGGGRFKLTMK